MKRLLIMATMASLAAPVLADPPPHAPAHGRRAKEARAYHAPRRLSYDDRIYRGHDGRYYCRRSDGTTGLIVGGLAGGVLGNVIAPGGSKTLGTIVGAGAGALVGRAIDRGEVRCR